MKEEQAKREEAVEQELSHEMSVWVASQAPDERARLQQLAGIQMEKKKEQESQRKAAEKKMDQPEPEVVEKEDEEDDDKEKERMKEMEGDDKEKEMMKEMGDEAKREAELEEEVARERAEWLASRTPEERAHLQQVEEARKKRKEEQAGLGSGYPVVWFLGFWIDFGYSEKSCKR